MASSDSTSGGGLRPVAGRPLRPSTEAGPAAADLEALEHAAEDRLRTIANAPGAAAAARQKARDVLARRSWRQWTPRRQEAAQTALFDVVMGQCLEPLERKDG